MTTKPGRQTMLDLTEHATRIDAPIEASEPPPPAEPALLIVELDGGDDGDSPVLCLSAEALPRTDFR